MHLKAVRVKVKVVGRVFSSHEVWTCDLWVILFVIKVVGQMNG